MRNRLKDKWDYLYRLKLAIEHLHKCSACYLCTQLVDEIVHDEIRRREIVWIGDVEVFTLTGHHKAKHCYAWSRRRGKNDEGKEQFFVVLEIPPVVSPVTAVRASIVADLKER